MPSNGEYMKIIWKSVRFWMNYSRSTHTLLQSEREYLLYRQRYLEPPGVYVLWTKSPTSKDLS